MSRRHPLELVFDLGLRALPPGPLREQDRDQMRQTLRDQLEAEESVSRRWWIAGRAVRRLPGVLLVEWLEWLGVTGPARGLSRHEGGDGMMRSWVRNVDLAGRSLRRSPTFTIAVVVLIGLGVGTVTTAFTVVDHVLLRSLPYPAADRLVYLTNGSHNGATLERLDGVEAFELWTATSAASVNLTRVDGDPRRLRRIEVTPSFFTLFGARPHLGRVLVDADRNRLDVAVISYAFWRDALGGDPDAVGTTMQVDGAPIEIVGVLTEGFTQPSALGDPAHFYRPVDWANPGFEQPGFHAHSVIARLAPGVSLEQANEQIDRVAGNVATAYPDYYSEGAPDWPLLTLHETTVEDVQGSLLLLLGAVGLLLLVACANVAHLFMARGLTRSVEMSIRRAMGARTSNLLAQLSAESLVVGLVGGAVGAGIAAGGLSLFRRWTVQLPRGTEIALDLRVMGVCILIATITAFVFGLVPALRTVGRDVHEGLRAGLRSASGGRRVQAMRSGLVVLEVALSLVLVASAGLLMRSFVSVTSIEPGVVLEDVWMLPLNPANVESADDYRARMEAIRTALLGIPGVSSVTFGIEAPFEHVGGDRCCWTGRLHLPDEPDANQAPLHLHPVSIGFFETFRTDIVAGRAWSVGEPAGAPWPAVISEALSVRRFGSAEAAVGRELPQVGGGIVVVGVAEQTRHYGLDQSHDYAAYLPIEAMPFPISRVTFSLLVTDIARDFASQVREAVWSKESDLPVPQLVTLDEWVDQSSATRRLGSLLFGAFGTVALLLAAAGLYGTLLYTVGQRRRELGIRLALGAERARIQSDVLRRGAVHAILGVAAGAAVTVWVGRLLERWLYGISATDPATLAVAALVLFVTAVGASWLPAYRAGRTDPLETLKAE